MRCGGAGLGIVEAAIMMQAIAESAAAPPPVAAIARRINAKLAFRGLWFFQLKRAADGRLSFRADPNLHREVMTILNAQTGKEMK